ncbi:MAG: hypothetical protein IPJ17_17895 [Holophagales bacterium]|nr:MAG: hypothetical protein IPJ17_17895 [Holophagales bacterium]
MALASVAFVIPASVTASDLATAVSPGATERPSEIGSACPTFSWSAVAGAAGHELAVLDLTTKGEPVVVLRHPVEGSASSWTPSLAECLKPGGSFAWTVRALDASGRGMGSETGWSAPKRFTIRAIPTADEVAAAIDLLRRWQSQSTGGSGSGVDADSLDSSHAASFSPLAHVHAGEASPPARWPTPGSTAHSRATAKS